MRLPLLLALLLAGAGAAPAASYFVSIAGLGGAPDYDAQFSKWAEDLEKELGGNPSDVHVTTLSGAGATRQALSQTLTRLNASLTADDSFALFLIGHGTFDGEEYKFNLPGPDMTASEMAALINKVPARRQLIVNMTSCSGASLRAFAKKDRIVITATKSGTEKNAPVFARYWVDALRDPTADVDKNGTITAQEAFNYAQRKTVAYFEAEKLLATEHSILTDTGKVDAAIGGEKTPASKPSLLAAAFPLVKPQSVTLQSLPAGKQKLLTHKEELEAKIDKLKFEKAALPPDLYKQQLSSLLLELARTQAEIDK